MTNKLITLSALLLVLLFVFPQTVSADVIEPGTKSVSWCYEISNVNDYPDYVFVYNEERVTGHGIIHQGDCFSFYKIGLTSIYAIKKTEFNENELNREFFSKNNPKLIKSNLQLNAFGSVQENDPLQKAVITLDIVSLTENNINIQKSKVIYTYTDGTSEEKVFQTQDITPESSRTAISPWWFAKFWYVVLPIVAILLIGLVLLLRRLKK